MVDRASVKAFSKATSSFLPGPALLLFGHWANAFSSVGLSNPVWEGKASGIGIALGTVLSLVIQRVTIRTEQDNLRRHTITSTKFFVASILLCFLIYLFLGHSENHDFNNYVNDFWSLVFIVAITSLCITLTFASMVDDQESAWLFWLYVVIAVVVIFGLGFLGVRLFQS